MELPSAGERHRRGEDLRRRREHAGDFLRGRRLAVEPALSQIASEPEQHAGLGGGLDAFGHRHQSQALAEPHHGRDDLAAFADLGHRTHKTAVHLQLVEGQRLKMQKAGIAGAEVVERQPAPELLQFDRDGTGAGQVLEQRALGHFDGEAIERELAPFGTCGDHRGNARVLQLNGGEVARRDAVNCSPADRK